MNLGDICGIYTLDIRCHDYASVTIMKFQPLMKKNGEFQSQTDKNIFGVFCCNVD